MMLLKKNRLMMLLLLMVVGSFVFLGSASDAGATDKVVFSARYWDGPNQSDCNKIYTMDSDGSEITRVGDMPCVEAGGSLWGQADPTWTHYGTKIMFLSFANCEGMKVRIMSMDADGSNITPLTSCEFQSVGEFDWSPELPSSLASVSPFGQFLLVFMLGGISAVWMMKRREAVQSPNASS